MARRSGVATIAEVAVRAGVSPATVSRVMNGRFAGEPQVAERVRAAASELSYAPSHLARALALGETKAIALVVPDLANPAFQEILSGLSKAAAKDGYRVLVADSAESPAEEPALATEIRRRCDAIVLAAPRMGRERLVELADTLQPLVLINRNDSGVRAPSLSIDYRSGIQNLAQHLYDLGHRHVAYLQGADGSVSNAYRLLGLAAVEAALPDLRVERMAGGVGSEAGVAAARRVQDSGATAVLAFNDLVAVGLVHGLLDLGLRVPDDVSVTGFDDIPFARFLTPALTTASVPYERLGAEAWLRMRALVRGQTPAHDAVFSPRLELRASTAAPAGVRAG
jgi:LacI family transcriptional regulator